MKYLCENGKVDMSCAYMYKIPVRTKIKSALKLIASNSVRRIRYGKV